MEDAFSILCNSLSVSFSLIITTPSDAFTLYTDASALGVGGVLCVCRNGESLPVAFYSRQTKPVERRYSAAELELLAIVSTVEHFNFYLHANPFKIITDNKSLCYLYSSDMWNARIKQMSTKLHTAI